MTRSEAIALRTRQLNGAYVEPKLLQEAIEVIARTWVPLAKVPKRLERKGNRPRKVKPEKEQASEGVDIDAVHTRRPD